MTGVSCPKCQADDDADYIKHDDSDTFWIKSGNEYVDFPHVKKYTCLFCSCEFYIEEKE